MTLRRQTMREIKSGQLSLGGCMVTTHSTADWGTPVPNRELVFRDSAIYDLASKEPLGRLVNVKELGDFVAGGKNIGTFGKSSTPDREVMR